jgi:hypothetical protein
MFNQIGKLEVKFGERVYQLLCEVDSPIGEVHDALSQMKLYVINKMKDIESPPKPEES